MPRLEFSRNFEDSFLDFMAPDRLRIVLAANNPLIEAAAVARLCLQPGDTLVQFNAAPLFRLFDMIACHKVHLFNFGNPNGTWWGFSGDAVPDRDYGAQVFETLTLLFYAWKSPQIDAFLLTNGDMRGGTMDTKNFPGYSYPAGKFSSIGFSAVAYFRYVNLLRVLKNLNPLQLVLFGFSGDYPGGRGWEGHDFGFEQKSYDCWLELVRLDHAGQPIAPS